MTRRRISLPYGEGSIGVEVNAREIDFIEPNPLPVKGDLLGEVEKALESPVESDSIEEILADASEVAISLEDETRPVPTKILLRALMDYLEERDSLPDRVKIVVASGLHDSHMEPRKEFGDAIPDDCEVEFHLHEADSPDLINFDIGGEKFMFNRIFVGAERKIVLGDVIPHYLYGFSGGSKSLLPGMADEDSITRTHSKMVDTELGMGSKDNPLRILSDEAAREVGIDFSVNIVQSPDGGSKVFAGDIVESFREAMEVVEKVYGVKSDVSGYDAIIASPGGAPRDINFYQVQKAFTSARSFLSKEGGKVFVFAKCPGGWGSNRCKNSLKPIRTTEEFEKKIDQIERNFEVGPHKLIQFSRDSSGAHLYLYADHPFRSGDLEPPIEVIRESDLTSYLESNYKLGVLTNAFEVYPR